MNAQLNDCRSIKVHTDRDGIVWFADGDRAPVSSGVDADAFAETLRARTAPRVRLIGNQANASLIMRMRRIVEEQNGCIEVASPLACSSLMERVDPEIALFRMRQCNLHTSAGGWHQLTPVDWSTFALVAQIHRDGTYLPTSRYLLRQHPLWRTLSFIGGIDETWSAWLIHTIVDPRWYVDPERPGRLTRLRSFLGLNPRAQEAAMDEWDGDHPNHFVVKCRIVYSTWAACGPPSDYELLAPNNFLWRVFCNAGGSVKGALRASQRLVAFVAFAWLQAIYNGNYQSGRQRLLFMPEMLLKTADEIEAFRQHMA